MTMYTFAPCPDLSTNESNYAYWEGGFTDEELDKICEIGDSYPAFESQINVDKTHHDVRKSKVSWLDLNDSTHFIYDRMAYIARNLNGQFFDFNLQGFQEDFQYTVYGPDNSHYDWHMDKAAPKSSPRKLSLVLLLTDPTEYEGGDLQLFMHTKEQCVSKTRGMVHAFPSWTMHRVTPVTKGIRKTLVVWVTGPKFR
jgi:PKHD-type hydroxylase